MTSTQCELVELRTEQDVVRARQAARQWSTELGFSVSALTRLVTATSELARNTILHGGGGSVILERVEEPSRTGLRLKFVDEGPGIDDVEQAMADGYTTGGGLGLGLPGARRLSDSFSIASTPGAGTTVEIVGWL